MGEQIKDGVREKDASPGEFIAWELQQPLLPLKAASRRRRFMNLIPGNNAYRCLPMLIANQHGWEISLTHKATVTWHGGQYQGDCTYEIDGGEAPISQFGSGIITWRIPYLFQTPPGWNLWVRGPINQPKHGTQALEGIVETDWAIQPFFMSWKLTQEELPVTWDAGEPICTVFPVKRGEVESWEPIFKDIWTSELRPEAETFMASRTEFNATRVGSDWQKHYFQGKSPGETKAPEGEHQTRLIVQEFKKEGKSAGQVSDTQNP
jgi:hypothetical protein